MAAANMVVWMGNLGRDPDVRHTQSGITVATMNVAATRKWTDRNGDKKEDTQWMRVVCWDKAAKLVEEYLTRGSGVHVIGRLSTREYEDKDGVKRWTTEIVAERIQFLPRGQGGGKAPPHPAEDTNDDGQPNLPPPVYGGDDDIPF